jgi:hypothetical protein
MPLVALLATAVAVALALTLSGSVSAGAGAGDIGSGVSFGMEQARRFDEFPLYSAGERVEGLPLLAVLRREDTASYVSFVYGDCVAEDESGCAPPLEIQVWPACQRNLALYDSISAGGAVPERIAMRGVPAALFDDGTRLELQTGSSTVVIFAGSRARLLRIAAALRAVDGSVAPGGPLPQPERDKAGGAMDC